MIPDTIMTSRILPVPQRYLIVFEITIFKASLSVNFLRKKEVFLILDNLNSLFRGWRTLFRTVVGEGRRIGCAVEGIGCRSERTDRWLNFRERCFARRKKVRRQEVKNFVIFVKFDH